MMTTVDRHRAWSPEDEAAVRSTVADYFEGWFEGDAARMQRALHPDLAKRSLGEDGHRLDADTAELMVEKTARGVGMERRRKVGDPKVDIRVDDVYGTIASVTVNSAPYHEYLHLVRTRAGWRIANALWQWT
jgi:hypothetical protein